MPLTRAPRMRSGARADEEGAPGVLYLICKRSDVSRASNRRLGPRTTGGWQINLARLHESRVDSGFCWCGVRFGDDLGAAFPASSRMARYIITTTCASISCRARILKRLRLAQ